MKEIETMARNREHHHPSQYTDKRSRRIRMMDYKLKDEEIDWGHLRVYGGQIKLNFRGRLGFLKKR